MDSFIIILQGGVLKEVGRDIVHNLGVHTYLPAIAFDPHSFWFTNRTRSLQS